MIAEEELFRALRGVMHPEFKRDLVELEMIQGVDVEDDQVTVTLALPFIDVPVKDAVVRGIIEAASGIASTALPTPVSSQTASRS